MSGFFFIISLLAFIVCLLGPHAFTNSIIVDGETTEGQDRGYLFIIIIMMVILIFSPTGLVLVCTGLSVAFYWVMARDWKGELGHGAAKFIWFLTTMYLTVTTIVSFYEMFNLWIMLHNFLKSI